MRKEHDDTSSNEARAKGRRCAWTRLFVFVVSIAHVSGSYPRPRGSSEQEPETHVTMNVHTSPCSCVLSYKQTSLSDRKNAMTNLCRSSRCCCCCKCGSILSDLASDEHVRTPIFPPHVEAMHDRSITKLCKAMQQ